MAIDVKKYSNINIDDFDAIVVGAGFAGSVVARELAERANKKVLILEKRNHIAGNMYDCVDRAGILIHNYGPHIFHTNDKRAYDYVCGFSNFIDYQHEVLADLNGKLIPVPFNKNSIEACFDAEKAKNLISKLVSTFGDEKKVPINDLRKENDPELSELADFIYNNVFEYYTRKQWDLKPEELDPSVTARVPVFISRDNRYFQDKYQGMPEQGYTKLFKNLLSHENITICLGIDAENVLGLTFKGSGTDTPLDSVRVQDKEFEGEIIYTGPIDELLISRYGRLPYRSLNFVYETLDKEEYQPCATVNYTISEDYTRITEFKHMTGQKSDKTTIMKEYSCSYEDPKTQIPYYAILKEENLAAYEKYRKILEPAKNFHILGRLAEYKYYNMDAIIVEALKLADKIIEG